MRLTTVILIASFLQVSASTFGQKITLKQENTPLRAVLKEIRRQSGYDIFYDGKTIPAKQRVSVQLSEAPIKEALDKVLGDLNVTYQINNKEITIKEKEEPSFLDRVTAYFASISVRGAVVDENGQPMAGVTVSVKNGKLTTSTDSYGGFYIKNIDENATIILSFLGYVTQEISVNGRDGLGTIKMKLSESKLDEVQVQAYGKTSKRLTTSNITTIKAEDIAKQPVDNPLYALMGRVPGLTITPQSGMPGGAVKVQIRGQSSLSEVNSEPLFIVDGIPVVNNMAGFQGGASSYGTPIDGNSSTGAGNNTQISALPFLNPKDIESIDVLKDADATAIYGSRGANGVILITTKKGKIGETKIDGNFSSSFSYVGKKYDLMNTEQYIEMRRQAYINDGLQVPDANILGSQKTSSNFDLTVWDRNRYTDWQKVLLGGTAKNYNANASISGGSPLVRYLIGGNFSKQGYVFPGDGNSINGSGRINISGNSPNNRFRSNIMAVYTLISSTATADFSGLAYTLAPNAPSLYNKNGDLNWEPNPSSAQGEGTWGNPFAGLLKPFESTTNTIQASFNASYQIISNLDFTVQSGLSRTGFDSFNSNPIGAMDPAVQSFMTGSATLNSNKTNTWSVEPQLSYNTTFSKGRLNLLIGGSYQGEFKNEQAIVQGNYKSDALLRSLSFGNTLLSFGTSSEYRYIAAFGRVNYNWDDRYVLNLTARRDGSSRFGPGNQFGNFGSVGGAWLFTNEAFLKDEIPFLSFGKLRASYGVNGNDAIGDYKYLQLFFAEEGKYQNSDLISSLGPVNPDYHWESKKNLELGLELGLFKDRISISGSYFRARSSEQLLTPSLPATVGGGLVLNINDATTKIQNSGFELNFTSQNLNDNFKWTTNFNISFLNKNKILAGDDVNLPSRLFSLYGNKVSSVKELIGKPYSGVVAVYEYRGINQTDGFYQFAAQDGSTLSQESLFTRWDHYAKLININPQYYGGLTNQFTYKGISVSVFLQFTKQIGKSPIYNLFNGIPGTANNNLPVKFTDLWMPGNNSVLQRVVSGQNYQSLFSAGSTQLNMVNSDKSWVDASFIRIKNISASYQVPESISKKLKMKGLNIGITGQNLFTITGYQGLDPETQSILSLPPLRTVSFNVSIGF